MLKLKKFFVLAGMIAVLAVLVGCPEPGGNSNPIPNELGAITGKVVYSNSDNHSDILVSIEKSDGLITESVSNVAGLTTVDAIESARSAVARSVMSSTKVNADGTYTFKNLTAGTYTIYASSNISKERAVTTNVTVMPSEIVSAAELKLTATGSISGKVKLDGAGKAGFIVNLASTSYIAVTGEDGSFTISDVPVGTEYNLSVLFGTYIYFVKGKVKAEAGKTKTITDISLTTDDIKNKSLISDGKDGADGTDGTDGTDGKDGISITWRGSFKDAKEIKEPKELNAYYNTEDGCSYIYVDGEWKLLASAGKNGADGKDGTANEVLYTFDIMDVATASSSLPYNTYGDNYQHDYDFTDYTNRRNIKVGDKINVKAKIVSDVDIESLNCVLVDNYDSKWHVYTAEGKYKVAEKIKAGVPFDIDYTFDITMDQIQQFSIVLNTDDTKACEKAPNLTFTRVAESTKTYYEIISEPNQYVSFSQNERGINFSGTILSNVYSYDYDSSYSSTKRAASANVTVTILNDTTGIRMIQDWNKSAGDWVSWNLTYPLVEKGKKYDFTVTVSNSNWTLYQEKFTITAEGGLGELKVENASKIETIVDSNRVIKRTEKPEFTDNKNIRIISKGTFYEFYRDVLWSGLWLYGTTLWDGQYDETLPLKDLQTISGWRSFDWIDNVLKGHKYIARGYTQIKIAGFTYNDTAYFEMNDASQSSDDWGGEILKVAVLFDESLRFGKDDIEPTVIPEVLDLPGEKITFTESYIKNGKTITQSITYNAVIVNYGDSIEEPINVPYYKNAASSKFNYWETIHGYKVSFPYSPSGNYLYEEGEVPSNDEYKVTANGELISYIDYLLPNITSMVTVTFMDGDEVYLKKDIPVGTYLVATNNSPAPDYAVPRKDGHSFNGWYADKDFKVEVERITENAILYAKWDEVQYSVPIALPEEPICVLSCSGYDNYIELPKIIREGSGYKYLYAELKYESEDGIQALFQLMSSDNEQASSSISIGKDFSVVSGACLAGSTYQYWTNGSAVPTDCVDTASKVQFYIQDSSYNPTSGTIHVKSIWLEDDDGNRQYIFD